MKTRNQLITSAFALMMVFVLLLGSTAVMAGSGFEASAPGAAPTVTITAPAANSYNNTGSVTAKWDVTKDSTVEWAQIWNYTMLTNVSTGWIEPAALQNKSNANSYTYSGLAEGQYIIQVWIVYWDSVAGALNESQAAPRAFTVDLTNPSIDIVSPVDASMIAAQNFTASWTTSADANTVTGQLYNATGDFYYPVKSVSKNNTAYWITNFSMLELLDVGQWSLNMTVADHAGNMVSKWTNFTVSPYVTIDFPGEFTKLTNFTFAWTPSLIPGTTLGGYDVALWNVTGLSWFTPVNGLTVPNVWLHNLTSGADLANGDQYIVYVNMTDSNGDWYNASQEFVVDTTAPTVFWVIPQNGTLINNNNLALQWAADSGLAPIVLSNVTLTNSTAHNAYLDITGATNTTTLGAIWGSAVPDGVYTLKVVVHDGAGNTAQAMTNFTLDATAPAFDIASPSPGSFTKLNNFTASWSVIETGSGFVSAWGRLVNVSGTFSYPWMAISGTGNQWITNFSNHQLLAEGTWALQLNATDVAGNNGTTISTFTVDQAAPTATIDVPGTFINQANFTASWTASGTGSPVSHYRVKLESPTGASPGFSSNITASSAWITNFTVGNANLTEGAWTMELFVEDMAGNSATVTKVFTVDLTKPLVVILFPVADGDGVATKDVNVTWDGSDVLAGIDHYNVSIDGAWTVLGDVKYNVFLNLSEGSHTVDVVAFDNAGNTQIASRTFIVDVTNPIVAITFPMMDQIFKVDTVNATWDMSDTNLASAEVSLDGADYLSVGLNNWSEMTALADGTHTLSVKVYDVAGNWAESNVTFFVDKVNPVVAILNPVDGSYYNVTSIVAAWLGVDPTPSSGIAYYESQLDSEGWQFMGATTVRVLTLTEGPHVFQVRAWDNATNNFTTSVSFVVDLTKPDVSVLFPSEGMMFGSTDVFMNWTATDGQTGIASYEIMIDDGGWMPMANVTEYTFTGLTDGTHIAYVKASDLAGNYNVTSVSFVVDVTSPYVVITAPVEGDVFGVDSVFVEWTAVDNTTGLSYWWAWVDDDAPVNVTGALNYTFTGLDEGDHVIHVKAWDMVGNAQEKMVNMVTDLSAPIIDITSPANLAHLNSRTVTVNFDVTDNYSSVQEIWVKLSTDADWTSVGLDSSFTLTVPADATTTPYTFMVKAQDVVGNEGTSEVQFYVDTVAPTIVSHIPATGANGVARGTGITIVFNEEMLQSTVTVSLSPGAVAGTLSWNGAKTEFVFMPSSNLDYATVYTVDVSGRDLANNQVTGTWTFTTIALVTGQVKDVNGNPIANATVNMTKGADFWKETKTGPNGNFALEIPVGTYNLTISAPGQKDLVRNDVVVGVGGSGSNVIPDLGMAPEDNWTWIIVAVVIIVAALLILLYLRSKGKLGKKPEESKPEESKPEEKK